MRNYLIFRYLTSIDGAIFLVAIAVLYWQLGASRQLPAYYHSEQKTLRQNQQALRPLYAELQRELIKSRLGLPVALDNLELIMRFAMLHSQMGQGLLPDEVQGLLQAVIEVAPTQITALNLLAIDAYKKDQLSEALQYWRQILALGLERVDTPDSVALKILRQKVAELEKKLAKD